MLNERPHFNRPRPCASQAAEAQKAAADAREEAEEQRAAAEAAAEKESGVDL